MRHYTYHSSSAAYRVRIALNLKGLQPEERYIHLTREGGEQHGAAYAALNPQALVPTLEDQGHVIGQSLAILEYLEETHPSPPLLPRDPAGRARVRQIACAVACDIHPLNNLRVRQYLSRTLRLQEGEVGTWYRHWIDLGFTAIEAMLSRSPDTGRFVHGDAPSLADVCLIPQVYNARRYQIPLQAYPTIVRIEEEARALPAFALAAPERQPDAG